MRATAWRRRALIRGLLWGTGLRWAAQLALTLQTGVGRVVGSFLATARPLPGLPHGVPSEEVARGLAERVGAEYGRAPALFLDPLHREHVDAARALHVDLPCESTRCGQGQRRADPRLANLCV